jgi:anti-sigma regulatory factor (Ser/Thr protein kinase)
MGSVFSPVAVASSVEVTLARLPSAVSLSRRLTREWFRHWGLPNGFCRDAELVASELVTNSVTNTAGPVIGLRILWVGECGYVEVWDGDPAPPIVRRPAGGDPGGRGLVLVAAASARWGYYHAAGGKVVWAQMRPAHGQA